MNAVDLRFRRVVFGIADASVAAPAISTAAELAQALAVDLYGFFIEDAVAFAAAALPELRAIEPRGLQWRSLTARENAEAHVLAARAAERHMLDAAAALGIAAVFQVVRGDPATALVQRVEPSDLVVFAEPDDPMARALPAFPRLVQALRATAAAMLFVPHGARSRTGPVVALVRSDRDPALQLAGLVATALRERLFVQAIDGGAASLLTLHGRHERLYVIGRDAVRNDLAAYLQVARARRVPLLIAPATAR